MAKSNTAQTTENKTDETTKESVNEIQSAGYKLDDLMKEHKTKSGVIRFLAGKGYKNGPISKFMGIRYQHVRNVLNQKLKGDDKPATTTSK